MLFAVAWRLFGDVHGTRRVRLLGIYASGFGDAAQLGLFERPARRRRSPARRAWPQRFGDGALTRASLLGRRERRNPSDKPPR